MSSYLRHYSVLYELNTLDDCWIAVDVWSNSSRCRHESVYLTRTWCLYTWSCLDILITLRFLINCSKIICLPTVWFPSREKPLVKPMAPGSMFHHIFLDLLTKNTSLQLIHFYFVLHFSNLLHLSLSDLTFASDCERIDNSFIALGASVGLFVQVHRLETCVYLVLDW